MKKAFALLALLSLVLTLGACAQEKEAAPTLRYEQQSAYYEETDAQEAMELVFAEEIAAGSRIALLNGETEVFAVTVDSAMTSLTIRSAALTRNTPYTLTVNGVVQQHEGLLQPPAIGEITIPEQPTVPQEPMGEVPPSESVSADGFTPGAGTIGGEPLPTESIPFMPGSAIGEPRPGDGTAPIEPPKTSPGELPSEGFDGKKPPNEDFLIERGTLTFMLTSQNNRFTGIRDAVQSEGKEPNA